VISIVVISIVGAVSGKSISEQVKNQFLQTNHFSKFRFGTKSVSEIMHTSFGIELTN